MKANYKKLRKSTAVHIVAALLLANLVLFLIARSFISDDKSEVQTEEVKTSQVMETGWQVVHWSYSLLKYFKPGPEA